MGESVKQLTREDISNYGKGKQIIFDAATAATFAPEDPRKGMSEEDQMAKACADRLFELNVTARRLKKAKIQKLEEEAHAKATAEGGDGSSKPVEVDDMND
mmetsp:Transcript_49182/g.66936  ORF Transcript_49182/g.66936 Transcript_49182/m.66936 type:complete len:101 (+) Transcript_49182:130-432(+)